MKFEFRSLLGLKSVLDELENATQLTFQEAFPVFRMWVNMYIKNDLEILSVLTCTAKWNLMVNYSSNATTYVIC